MNRLVTGRISQVLIASTLLILGLTLRDQGSAEAQGPLRRLGDRIRSRVEPLIQPPPAPANVPPQASSGLRSVAPYAAPTTPVTPPAASSRLQPRLKPTPSNGNVLGAPSIGIEVEEFNQGFRGVRVVSFRSNSKANSTGLSVGDIIVGVEGRETSTIDEIAQALSPLEPGQSAQLRIVQSGSLPEVNRVGGQRQIPTQFLNVPLVDRVPPARQIAASDGTDSNQQATYNQQPGDVSLGVELSNSAGRQGAVVASVAPRSPGEVARMQAGDRIVSINGRMVQSPEGVSQVLNRSKPGDQLRIQWVRGDQLREANVLLAGKDGIAPNAMASRNPSATNQAEGSTEPDAGSLLNGIGSAVGNWFGSGSEQPAKPATPSASQKATSSASSGELPNSSSGTSDALTDLSGPSILMKADDGSEELPMPSAVRDPLEFGDEELVQPAGFGEATVNDGTSVLPIPSVLDAGVALPAPGSLPNPDASFHESRKPTLTPLDGTMDPPSLGNVTLPSNKPAVATSNEDQAIVLLRAEVERLRSRIQELEKTDSP